MAGKDKSLRWMRLFLGAYNLSGDARTFSSLDNKFDEADLSGWSNAVRQYLAGSPRMVGLRGFQALLNDATAGAFAQMKDADNQSRLSILFGGNGEPAIGDPAYLLPSVQLGDNVGLDSLAPIIQGDFLPDAAQFETGIANPLGKVLHPETSLSATTNGASVNNGAASAGGGYAILHLTAVSSASWALKVQHSANDADWSDLITFTADGSAIASELGVVTGTVNQYLRFQATRTGGSLTPVVSFARV